MSICVSVNRTRPACLDKLPEDIVHLIMEHLLEDWNPRIDEDARSRKDNNHSAKPALLSLGAINRTWHDIVVPYLYRDINLISCTNFQMAIFLELIVPKYGRFCQWLRFSFCVDPPDVLRRTHYAEFLSEGRVSPRTAHAALAERSGILAKAIRSMPNVSHVRISIPQCPCDLRFAPECICHTTYHDILEPLSHCRLQSVSVWLSFTSPTNIAIYNDWLARLLENACATIEAVNIDCLLGSSAFHIGTTFAVLSRLPHLTHLNLKSACRIAQLENLRWQCPLRKLAIAPDTDIYIVDGVGDIGSAFQYLPGSLEDLAMTFYHPFRRQYLASVPFPSHLGRLQNLRIYMDLFSESIVEYLHACPARRVFITIWRDDPDPLIRSVQMTGAFSKAEMIEVIYYLELVKEVRVKFKPGGRGWIVDSQ